MSPALRLAFELELAALAGVADALWPIHAFRARQLNQITIALQRLLDQVPPTVDPPSPATKEEETA